MEDSAPIVGGACECAPLAAPSSSADLPAELLALLPIDSTAPTWHARAIDFARTIPQTGGQLQTFVELCRQIRSEANQQQQPQPPSPPSPRPSPSMAAASVPPILPPMATVPAAAASSPMASPAPSEVVAAVQDALAQPPASSTSPSTPAVAAAASSSPAAAAVASPVAPGGPASVGSLSDVLLTIADLSVLAPKGKFTLVLTLSHLHLTNPSAPAKNLALAWSDVDLVCDVPDLNKRDWLLVLQLKKDKGLLVGKKTQPAIVLKFLMTEKVKEGRFIVAAPSSASSAAAVTTLQRMQAFVQSGGFVGSKVSAGVLHLMRMIPSMQRTTVVGHEAAIYDSLKKLPCVGCHHGVDDGALYFLRTGLLFVKPVIYIAIADINGIDPARGASSTFDMRVGIEGQKHQIEFKMIEPKEEGAITKYCLYLAQEQARLEKEAKQRKAGTFVEKEKKEYVPMAAAAATPSVVKPSTTIELISSDDEGDAAQAKSQGGISAGNIIQGKRPKRAAVPKTFAGMESESEKEEEAEPAKKKPRLEATASRDERKDGQTSGADEDGDSDASGSSDDDEYSEASSDSSDDSAEYDSAADEKSIHSDDDDERERARNKKATRTATDDEESTAPEDDEPEGEQAGGQLEDEEMPPAHS